MEAQSTIDYYDTGLWHLTVEMWAGGVKAFIRNLADVTAPVRMLLDEHWEPDAGTALQKIENAVYDHPSVLDDYSATVLIHASDFLWIPSEAVDSDEGNAEKVFTAIYPATDPDDIFIEMDGDLCCLYSGMRGMKSFFSRTFPGARICGVQPVLLRKFRNYPGGGTRIYIYRGNQSFTILAFEGKKLICACTRQYREDTDILYSLLLSIEAYGLDPQTAEMYVAGETSGRQELMKLLRKHFKFVMLAMIPVPPGMEDISQIAVMASLQTVKDINSQE